jgi:phosphoribosylformylglycinamidine cyclo-ligase
LSLLAAKNLRKAIKGIAHITGGAFYDKIARILPVNLDAAIERNSWVVPGIFQLIQSRGDIDDREMYHTLNMGIGMVLIVESGMVNPVKIKLSGFKLKSWVIGEIQKGKKSVRIV